MSAIVSNVIRLVRPRRIIAAVLVPSVGGLLTLAMFLPDRVSDKASAAGEVQRVSVTPVRPRRTVSLRDRLVVGLQARLKSEVEFVELVVERVQTVHLPQRLVDETFFWARERATVRRQGRSRRPIRFFQPAMRARATRIGVEL
jgi:hypothetical protein